MESKPNIRKNLKLLIVEDNRADYLYLWELLNEINTRAKEEHWTGVEEIDTIWVQTLSEALNKLEGATFDAILLDLSLPDSEGMGSIDGIREKRVEIQMIVLSGYSA